MTPESLAIYVGAVLGRTGPRVIVGRSAEKACWQDQGFDVREDVETYHFDNGVILRRTVEQDDFPAELACAECWITYEVLSHGTTGIEVSPARKVFDNACREGFWLAYHTD